MSPGNGKSQTGVGIGTRAPTPTSTTTRLTRNSTQPSLPTREEIVSQDRQVKDADGGAAYLERSLLCLVGEPFTIEHLATVLFHTTQLKGVPMPAVEAIRAVAFLLEREATTRIADAVATQIRKELSKEVASHVITAISPHVANLFTTNTSLNSSIESLDAIHSSAAKTLNNETLTSTANQVTTAADTVSTGITTVKEAVDQLAPSLVATQDSIKSFLSATADSASNFSATQSARKSYSDAARSPSLSAPLSAPATAALARAAIRERQILLDPHKGHTLHTPEQTTASIAERLKAIIDEIRTDDAPPLIIKAITRLKNGGLIIELDSAESAAWLRQDDNKTRFLEKLGTPVVMKDRNYVIMVPFLPISSPLDDDTWLRSVELENSLRENSLASARWIKQKDRRTPNQRVAHAIFTFAEPHAANNLLRDGLYICKEKLHPRKEKKEPLRCARCQGWGHIARDCKAIHDTCASCGHAHRTDACTEKSGKRYCVNCKTEGHGSNNMKCHTFLTKCAELDAKLPENSMPYFPTDEPWTQVMLPPKQPPLANIRTAPQKTPHPQRPSMRQTTLDPNMPLGPRGRGSPRPTGRPNGLAATPHTTTSNATPINPTRRPHTSATAAAAAHLPSSSPSEGIMQHDNTCPPSSMEGWD